MGDGVPTLLVLRGKWVTNIFVDNGFHICEVASLIKKADYFSLAGLSGLAGMPVKNEKARSLILGLEAVRFSSPDISLSQRSSTFLSLVECQVQAPGHRHGHGHPLLHQPVAAADLGGGHKPFHHQSGVTVDQLVKVMPLACQLREGDGYR
jgi:hypothetical protein